MAHHMIQEKGKAASMELEHTTKTNYVQNPRLKK